MNRDAVGFAGRVSSCPAARSGLVAPPARLAAVVL